VLVPLETPCFAKGRLLTLVLWRMVIDFHPPHATALMCNGLSLLFLVAWSLLWRIQKEQETLMLRLLWRCGG
jgi:hypothetical protein